MFLGGGGELHVSKSLLALSQVKEEEEQEEKVFSPPIEQLVVVS